MLSKFKNAIQIPTTNLWIYENSSNNATSWNRMLIICLMDFLFKLRRPVPLKMSVSCMRNAHFHKITFFDFDCHFDKQTFKKTWKINQNSINIEKKHTCENWLVVEKHFWYILLHFGGVFWIQNTFKNLMTFCLFSTKRVREIRHLKYTLPALFTSENIG